MIPLGMLAGADVTVVDMLIKNFLPTTLGNTIAGSVIVAGGYSYAFGRLGNPSPKPVDPISREDMATDEEAGKKDPKQAEGSPEANVADAVQMDAVQIKGA